MKLLTPAAYPADVRLAPIGLAFRSGALPDGGLSRRAVRTVRQRPYPQAPLQHETGAGRSAAPGCDRSRPFGRRRCSRSGRRRQVRGPNGQLRGRERPARGRPRRIAARSRAWQIRWASEADRAAASRPATALNAPALPTPIREFRSDTAISRGRQRLVDAARIRSQISCTAIPFSVARSSSRDC